MNWLPNFLNPMGALIAGAISIPLLVLLYFLKLRRQERLVASTLLWKKAVQDLQVNAPFQRLRRNLLLLLQLLILLALLLALARPVAKFAATAGKTNVILIDNSASMNVEDASGRTRLEDAKRRALDVVATMRADGASAMVVAFADETATRAVQPFTTDGQALRTAIDSIQPTDRKSRLKLAYQLAEATAAFIPEQNRPRDKPDVFLYSDGRVLDGGELSLTGNLRFEPIGDLTLRDEKGSVTKQSQTANVGIVAVSARRNYERPTEVQVFARLANFGPSPVEAPVQLSVAPLDPARPATLDFSPRGAASSMLLPERWSEEERQARVREEGLQPKDGVEFTLELTTAAVIKVEQTHTEGDALTADDAAMVVVPPPKNLAVLHVTDGENPFLDKALSSLNLKDVKTLTADAYEQAVPTEFDVIVFDRYSPRNLPPAGNFLYFAGLPPESKLKPELVDGMPQLEQDVVVLDWKRDHPIVRPLALQRIGATEAIRIIPPLDAEILVEGTKCPLVVLQREGRHTHLVVTFDTLLSNWPLRPSFPVFVFNAMQFLALGSEMSVRESFAPGTAVRIPRRSLEGIQQVSLTGPSRTQTIDVPATGDLVLPAFDQVGIYTLRPPVPGYEVMAVNLTDANESNVEPTTVAPGGIAESVNVTNGRVARTELWWWIIACGAVPFLLVEWWVYTRRVHL